MIECTDKNLCYKRRKKKRKKLLSVFLIFVFLIGGFLYYKNVIETTIIGICEQTLKSYSTHSVNKAVLEIVQANPYSEYVNVEKNEQGDIILITTDSVKVNELNRKIALKTEEILANTFFDGVKIPFLAFTGIKFLSGYGFTVSLKTINVSSVNCNFEDKLVSAGINQTLHSLFLSVETVASLEMPTSKKTETCLTTVLLGEAVIVGKVPEIYIKG